MEDEIPDLRCSKHEIGAERRLVTGDINASAAHRPAGSKPALLVEFPIIRQMRLRHDAEDLAGMDDHSTIIEPALMPQRCPHQQHRCQRLAFRHDAGKRCLDRIEQRVLAEQIVDRIA